MGSFEYKGIYIIVLFLLVNCLDVIQCFMGIFFYDVIVEDFVEFYFLIIKVENVFNWFGFKFSLLVWEELFDIKLGYMRFIVGGL